SSSSSGGGAGGGPACTPVDDGNPCTDDVCTDGVPAHPPSAAGISCSAGAMRCDGQGACVECLATADCAGTDDACQTRACVKGKCSVDLAPPGAKCDDGDTCTVGDGCQAGVCVGGTQPFCIGGATCSGAGVCEAPACTGLMGLPGLPGVPASPWRLTTA